MTLQRQRGLSLVEIAVVLTIAGILITLAVPSFATWIRNTQIRTATESVQNGLQLARAEAIRRNRSVQFTLTDVPSSGWTFGCVVPVDNGTVGVDDPGDCPQVIQTRSAAEGTAGPQLAATPATARMVTFNSIGQVIVNADASASLTQVDATDPTLASGTARPLRIVIAGGGAVRMCDPAVSATSDPRRCP